jgi:G-patch domain
MDKLDYHIKVSTLHKENLAKLSKNDVTLDEKVAVSSSTDDDNNKVTASTSTQSTKYVDRAKQRRIMHGVEASAIAINPDSLDDYVDDDSQLNNNNKSCSDTTTGSIQPGNDLNESNIGNQMLQKLGWKEGASLGGGRMKNEQQPIHSSETSTVNGSKSSNINNNMMAKEWSRIESIASSNAKSDSNRSRQNQQQQKQGGIGF